MNLPLSLLIADLAPYGGMLKATVRGSVGPRDDRQEQEWGR